MRTRRARFSPSIALTLTLCLLGACASTKSQEEGSTLRDTVTALQEEQAAQRQRIEALQNALYILQDRIEALGVGYDETRRGLPAAEGSSSARGATSRVARAVPTPDPVEIYRTAYDHLNSDDVEDALAGFRRIAQEYPHHPLAPNALYWMGEAYYSRREYAKALDEFRRVVRDYPKSGKASDALLKEGYTQRALGRSEEALGTFREVVSRYPRSTAAEKARDRIRELETAPASATTGVGEEGRVPPQAPPLKEGP